ncbi:MAG: hypothetical protein U0936_01305 [Planctomycetaceae bacterium]
MTGAVVANRVKKEKKVSYGYDALNDKYGDKLQFGVIDPTKVVRTSLQNAFSVASLMTTDCIVVNEPKKAEDGHCDDHHHDGMGGMGGMGGGTPQAGGMGMPGMM